MIFEGKEYLDGKESAEYLGISQPELSHLKRRCNIPSYHIDKTAHKYCLKEDLEKYKQNETPAGVMRNYFATFYQGAIVAE